MPIEVTKRYIRKRLMSPKKCSPSSFRFKRIGARKALIVCCPKGHWDAKRKRCRVGTRAQAVLIKRRGVQ